MCQGPAATINDAVLHSGTGSVLILLCTYNEVENLPEMVRELHQEIPLADILVVDDASPDGTGLWVAEAQKTDPKLFLYQRPGKLGLGTATRDGMSWCLERGYDYLIQMDSDFSHRPTDAPRLLQVCHQSECDIAVGTRYSGGGGHQMSLHRSLMSRCLNRYCNWLLKLPVSDCSGSFRCYRVAQLRKIYLNGLVCTGYGFLEELLVHLHRSGARMVEVPIQFDQRAFGRSKLGLGDALGVLRIVHTLARSR